MHFKILLISLVQIAMCFKDVMCQKGPNFIKPVYLSSPPLTCSDIKYIVNFHNDVRRSIANGSLPGQPKAANMQKMAWDPILAEVATNWTKKMKFEHNPNRSHPRFDVGENVFLTSTANLRNKKVEWNRPLTSWFNQHKIYSYKPTMNEPSTGHYTQMIWADVIYVGCGLSIFIDNKKILYKYYVCNYGPSGNYLGAFPYAEYNQIEGDLEYIKSMGLESEIEVTTCDDLCCFGNQCDKLYGPKCS